MQIGELKENLKQYRERFPEPLQRIGVFFWKDIEVQLGAVIERRRLLRSHNVVWPNAEVADFKPMPQMGPTPTDALVDVACTLVSPGTERAQFMSMPGAADLDDFSMFQPGYSGSGVVIDTGKRVGRFRDGDRVAGRIPHVSQAVVNENFLFHLPDNVSFADASFIELGIIVLQGIHKARIQPGESVIVIGQGLIGQLANRFCRIAGAAPIVGVARSRGKADITVANGGADSFMTVDEVTAAGTRYDVVVEATGDVNIMPFAASLVKDDGRVIGLGTPRGVGPFDMGQGNGGANRTVLGAHISGMPQVDQSAGRWTYRSEGEFFIDLLAREQIIVADLVSETMDPSGAGEFYDALAHNRKKPIGVMFDWQPY